MYSRSQKIIGAFIEKHSLDSKDIEKLCTLSKSNNSQLRRIVASLLGRVSDENAERTLYTLSFDRDEIVKLEAVDSLAIGKTELSVQRLRKICFCKNSYLKFFGIQSYCDVFLNLHQFEKEQKVFLLRFLKELERKEKDEFVLAAIYKCESICNDLEAAHKLMQMYITSIESNDLHLITPIYNLLSELEECVESKVILDVIESYKNE